MSLKNDELDYMIRDALHGVADNLEVPERVKQKIDRKVTEGMSESNFPYKESIELNLATVCLDLFESMEKRVGKMEVDLKYIPGDDAFDRKIIINNHVMQTLEVVILDLLSKFTAANQKVMVSTKENNITISGIDSVLEYLNGLCGEKDGEFVIEKSENALALAFLKLNECYIKEVMEEGNNIILIGL